MTWSGRLNAISKGKRANKLVLKLLVGMAATVFLTLVASLPASATLVQITTIPAGNSPSLLVYAPDGSKVYAFAKSDLSLKVIDPGTNQVTTSLSLPNAGIYSSIAITPDGRKLYISAQGAPSKVLVVDVSGATPSLVTQISTGSHSYGLTVSPNGSSVYVTNTWDNTISIIDVATNTVTGIIPAVASSINGEVMDYPVEIAFAQDGSSFYVTYYKDSTPGVAGIVKFNPADNSVVSKVEFGTAAAATAHPWGMDVASDGTLYVANYTANSIDAWVRKYDSGLSNPVNVDTTNAASTYQIQLSADDSLLYASHVAGGILNIYKTSNNARTTISISGTGSAVNYMIAASPNSASHFAYVGSNGNAVALIGEYLSQQRQSLSGDLGASLTSSPLTAYGFTGTVTYSISAPLPSGFSFNTATGVITGSSSTPFPATAFTITGSDGTVSAVATVTIAVNNPASSGSNGNSSSASLANTGMNNSLSLASGALGLSLIILGGVMVFARRMNKR